MITPASPYQTILENRTEGASALFEQFVTLSRNQSLQAIKAGLRACQLTFPLMAVWNYALSQLSKTDQDLDYIASQMAHQTRATIAHGSAALKAYSRILTLSNSSLVQRAVLHASTPPQVMCAVSDPGGEGQVLAATLAKAGLEVSLVADSEIPHRLPEAEAVSLGADQYDDHAFVNKVGSQELVAHARRLGKPVFVLAEGFKRVPSLPRLTARLAQLELDLGGKVARYTMFEKVPWQSHIRLVSSAG